MSVVWILLDILGNEIINLVNKGAQTLTSQTYYWKGSQLSIGSATSTPLSVISLVFIYSQFSVVMIITEID